MHWCQQAWHACPALDQVWVHRASLPQAPTTDSNSKREEVLHSLQKIPRLMQFVCAKCVKCIFHSISTLVCMKLLFAFRPVSRGLNYATGYSSSSECNVIGDFMSC